MVIVFVIIAIAVILALVYIGLRNGIVRRDNKCDNAWQNIDAQLQRRNDLIPNLVETVKGYTRHESETLAAVTRARAAVGSAATPKEKMAAADALTGALSHLFAVAEAYPDLKANANYQQLQAELADTENKISYARMSYNDVVLDYNNAIETFPGNVIAGSRFKPRPGFEVADEATRQAPKVQF